jgi:hypothetical protein
MFERSRAMGQKVESNLWCGRFGSVTIGKGSGDKFCGGNLTGLESGDSSIHSGSLPNFL